MGILRVEPVVHQLDVIRCMLESEGWSLHFARHGGCAVRGEMGGPRHFCEVH
jgi:CheY-like chemotaxis protein